MITAEQIAKLLGDKFPGTRKDVLANMAGLLALQVDAEDAAQTIVDALTAEKVQAFSKSYRSSIDAEIQQSNKTLEDNLRKKYDFKEKGTDPKPADPHPADHVDPQGTLTIDSIKAIFADSLAPLQQRMDAYDAAKVKAQRRETYMGKLKDAKLSQATINAMVSQFDAMSFGSDDAFNSFLATSQPAIDALAQEANNAALRNDRIPGFSTTNQDGVSQAVLDHIASRQQQGTGAASLGGKTI